MSSALKNQSRFSHIYVVCDGRQVVGYFCILTGLAKRGAPQWPDAIPAAVIRLAVNLTMP